MKVNNKYPVSWGEKMRNVSTFFKVHLMQHKNANTGEKHADSARKSLSVNTSYLNLKSCNQFSSIATLHIDKPM